MGSQQGAGAPQTVQPHRGERIVVAIDIGDSDMAVGLVTMHGELIDRDAVAIDRNLGAQAMYELLEATLVGQIERARDIMV